MIVTGLPGDRVDQALAEFVSVGLIDPVGSDGLSRLQFADHRPDRIGSGRLRSR